MSDSLLKLRATVSDPTPEELHNFSPFKIIMPDIQAKDQAVPGGSPESPIDEMGTSADERFTAMNGVRSSAYTKLYLQSLGYEVEHIGSDPTDFNFAVRMPNVIGGTGRADGGWRVLDPQRLSDLPGDIADLVGDGLASVGGFLGGAVGLALGGVPGAIAGGGAAGYGADLLRQQAGKSAGVPQEISHSEAAMQGLLQSGAEATGPALGMLARGAGKALPVAEAMTKGMMARLARLETSEGLSAVEALEIRAKTLKDMVKLGAQTLPEGVLPSPIQVGDLLKAKVADVTQRGFPETAVRDALLKQSTARVPMQPALTKLLDLKPSQLIFDKEAQRTTMDLLTSIAAKLNPAGTPMRINRVDINTAHSILEGLQDWIYRKGGWTGLGPPPKNPAISLAKSAAHELRTAIEKEMGGPASQYAKLQEILGEKIETKNAMIGYIGDDGQHAESWIANLHGSNKTYERRMLQRFDVAFGTNFANISQPAKLAAVERQFAAMIGSGTGGLPSRVPGFTATGAVLGPSLVSGYLGTTGPGATAAMITAGVAAFSPAGLVSGMRMGNAVNSKVAGMMTMLAKMPPAAVKAAGLTGKLAAQVGAVASHSLVTSEDERRVKRGPLVLE